MGDKISMKNKKNILGIIFLLSISLILNACNQEDKTKKNLGFHFEDITKKSNINFIHQKPTFDNKVDNLMPWLSSTGASVSTSDYDNDGNMDLYFTNSKEGSQNALYRNLGDGTFEDVSSKAGVALANEKGVSTASVWFDSDNDGDSDLFVGTWGESKFYKNNGDGTFTDKTEEANLKFKGYVAKVITLDYNKDGNLDLYLGNYFHESFDLWNLSSTKIMFNDFERSNNGGKNVLFKNNGDGTFTDVSSVMNVDDPGWTLATGSADINNDGWPDLYNANDFGTDKLLLNQKGKAFKEVVQKRGIGDDTFKGMNVDFADVFHDGNLAIFISNITKPKFLLEGNQLWHINKEGEYIDRAQDSEVLNSGWSWGARFFDINNSGEMSLMATNGFISASKEKDYWFEMGTLATTPGYVIEDTKNWPKFGNKSLSGYEKKKLFLNQNGKFTDVAQDVGLTFRDDGRGISGIDINNEGVLDLVFANQGSSPRIYKNKISNNSHWIKLNLVGKAPSNRDAVGARITFEVDGKKTIMERDGGNSFGGQSDPRIHFGLGNSKKVDKITIQWPSGRSQILNNVSADQILTIVEGTKGA